MTSSSNVKSNILFKDTDVAFEHYNQRSMRDIVSAYYRMQSERSVLSAHSNKLQESEYNHDVLDRVSDVFVSIEDSLYPLFETFSSQYRVGQWALLHSGITPVFVAGLISNIDISKAYNVSSVYRYCGIDPSLTYVKGSKVPWNTDLKSLVWKIGQSISKSNTDKHSFYVDLYHQNRTSCQQVNLSGGYSQKAKDTLANRNIKNTAIRQTLESGFLPDVYIDAQARKFAVKIFLAHFHTVWYEDYHSALNSNPTVAPRFRNSDYSDVYHIDVPNYVKAVASKHNGYII